MENYKIKLTTLSPVSIGNGQKLNHFADYIYDAGENKIHFVNKKVIAEKLAANENLMNRYIAGITTGMDNNRTKFELQNFLKNVLKLQSSDYTLYSEDAHTDTSKELNCIIKNVDGKPYIPGSTIKGALRNALLYNNTGINKDKLITPFLNEIKKGINKKEFNKKINQLNKNVEEFFIDKKIFNDKIIEFPKNKFGVSDSELIDSKNVEVRELKRISPFSEEGNIPQLFETLKPNTETFFTLSLDNAKDEDVLTVKKIFKRVNIFTQNNINLEKTILSKFENNTEEHSKLIEQFECFLIKLNNLNENECIMRIGFGKGFYFNSVVQLIYKFDETENKEILTKYLELLGYKNFKDLEEEGVYPEDAYIFPLTRNITSNKISSLGWVKLELIINK